jgi:hypothetical protein
LEVAAEEKVRGMEAPAPVREKKRISDASPSEDEALECSDESGGRGLSERCESGTAGIWFGEGSIAIEAKADSRVTRVVFRL